MKRNNPETSHEALGSLQPEDVRDTYRRILLSLDAIGEGTHEEIAAHMRVAPAKVWKRLSEMRTMGTLYNPGNKKRLRSGRNGMTWMRTSPAKTENELKELKDDQDFFTAFQNEKPKPYYVQPRLL